MDPSPKTIELRANNGIRGSRKLHDNSINYNYEFEFFAKCIASVRRFQMSLQGLSFVKTLATFKIVDVTDPFLQNITIIKIVCHRGLILDNFNYKLLHAELRARIFQNQRGFPHALSLQRSR